MKARKQKRSWHLWNHAGPFERHSIQLGGLIKFYMPFPIFLIFSWAYKWLQFSVINSQTAPRAHNRFQERTSKTPRMALRAPPSSGHLMRTISSFSQRWNFPADTSLKIQSVGKINFCESLDIVHFWWLGMTRFQVNLLTYGIGFSCKYVDQMLHLDWQTSLDLTCWVCGVNQY